MTLFWFSDDIEIEDKWEEFTAEKRLTFKRRISRETLRPLDKISLF